jgi:Domain of unknown function (DUF1932)
MPPRADRWVAEMQEFGATFASVGLPLLMLQGGAEIFALVANSLRDGAGSRTSSPATTAPIGRRAYLVATTTAENPSSVAGHRSPPRRDAVIRTGATALQDMGALHE